MDLLPVDPIFLKATGMKLTTMLLRRKGVSQPLHEPCSPNNPMLSGADEKIEARPHIRGPAIINHASK